MILGRVVILSLLMVGCIVATPWAYQQDAAVMALRLRAIQQIPSPIRLSNGERIDTTTYRGQLEALEALTTGSDNDRWQLADAYYLYAWRQAGGNRELAQTLFQSMTGLVSIREANRLFDQCAKRAPTVAATETAKAIQAAEAAKAAEAARAAQAAQAQTAKVQAEQAAQAQRLQAAAQAWQAARQQFPQGWEHSCRVPESIPPNSPRDFWVYCHATRGELSVTLYDAISDADEHLPKVGIDMGSYGGATALWFDDDTQRWTMRIPNTVDEGTGRFVTPSSTAPAVIARMLIASVLHYTYTPHQLPPSEKMDITVDLSITDFSQAWKELQELFRKRIDWYRKAYRYPNLYGRKSGR